MIEAIDYLVLIEIRNQEAAEEMSSEEKKELTLSKRSDRKIILKGIAVFKGW